MTACAYVIIDIGRVMKLTRRTWYILGEYLVYTWYHSFTHGKETFLCESRSSALVSSTNWLSPIILSRKGKTDTIAIKIIVEYFEGSQQKIKSLFVDNVGNVGNDVNVYNVYSGNPPHVVHCLFEPTKGTKEKILGGLLKPQR